MKKIISIISFLFVAANLYATTFTLNNSNPTAGQFTNWGDAQNAASNGDTILIHGSLINYYTLTISKKLVIIGPGHHPTDKQNQQKAFCDAVIFANGSTGCTVIGLECSNMQDYYNNIDSVTILNCRFNDALYFQSSNANNWIIDGCIFASSTHCIYGQGQSVGDMIVRNSILNGDIFSFNGTYIGYNYFTNNIFLSSTPYTFQYCNYFYINNCIFYRSGLLNYSNSGLSFNKNLSYQCVGGDVFPNGVNYTGMDPLFVTNIGSGAYFDYSIDYHLQATSPVKNGGVDGTDLGVYGGNGDYEQNGIGHNPYINTFNITGPTSVNAGDPIQVYIKAKVRN